MAERKIYPSLDIAKFVMALQKSEYADIPWTETLPECYPRGIACECFGKHQSMARAMHIPAVCGFGVIIFYCRSEAVGQI